MKPTSTYYFVALIILFVFHFNNSKGQWATTETFFPSTKSGTVMYNTLTTIDNKTIYFNIGSFTSTDGLSYTDTLNERKNIKEKQIASIQSGERVFVRFPIPEISTTDTYLMEVIGRNDKYILALFSGKQILSIYDYNKNNILRKTNPITYKKQKVILTKFIHPYFSDCNELLERLESNLRLREMIFIQLTDKIYNITCTDKKLE